MPSVKIIGNEPRIINIKNKENKMNEQNYKLVLLTEDGTAKPINPGTERQEEIEEMIQTIEINSKHEIPMNDWEREVLTRMLKDYQAKIRLVKDLRYRIHTLNTRIQHLEEENMDLDIELNGRAEPGY